MSKPTNEVLIDASRKAVADYLASVGAKTVEEQTYALHALTNRVNYQLMVLERAH